MSNAWAKGSAIDVKDLIKGKGNASKQYIPWMDAWVKFKQTFPDGQQEKHWPPEFLPDSTAIVSVTIRVPSENVEHREWLPVTDHSNRAIQGPDTHMINTAMQRCLTKAIAVATGIGSELWAKAEREAQDESQSNSNRSPEAIAQRIGKQRQSG